MLWKKWKRTNPNTKFLIRLLLRLRKLRNRRHEEFKSQRRHTLKCCLWTHKLTAAVIIYTGPSMARRGAHGAALLAEELLVAEVIFLRDPQTYVHTGSTN